jgi:hypothetical protein
MLPQLTYVVRDLFATAAGVQDRPGCLADYEADHFLIAAYQRGYKWKAAGLVQQLLENLQEAQEAGQPDYYLQYLTVKRYGATNALEVIDGQQRLTTLTLFFAVSKAANWLAEADFTRQRLDYAIRKQPNGQSLLDLYIYDQVALRQLLGLANDGTEIQGAAILRWEHFLVDKPPTVNRQDMFHLFEAAHCIYQFLKGLATDAHRVSLITYVAGSTRLIVNEVTRTTNSETVFHNINDNRKELTDLDLVKGLLLTRPARETTTSFRQILEQRAAQGRHWDEMATWLAQPEVAAVLGVATPAGEKQPKTGHPGMHLLLTLLLHRDARWPGYLRAHPAGTERFPFFAFLRSRLHTRQEDGRKASDLLREMRLLYQLLRDWYANPIMRNSLGVLHASNGFGADKYRTLLLRLTDMNNLGTANPLQPVRAAIRELPCLQALASVDAATPNDPLHWPVSYGSPDENKLIQDLLLLLNVFPAEARATGHAYPFDFHIYQKQAWSLEHIFPQNPDESYQKLLDEEKQQLLRLVAEADRATVQLLLAKSSSERTEEEQATLEALLKGASAELNSLGNLSLLSMKENPALRNFSFNKKRKILAKKVAEGAFVPAHTFGVFAKLVPAEGGTEQLHLWGPDDMTAHANYLLAQRVELQTYFSA